MKNKYLITNLIFSALFIILVALDRFTKRMATLHLQQKDIDIIPDILSFHYLENRGAAWGIFQGAFWLFLIITVIVVVAIFVFYSRLPFERRFLLLRFTIILLGAGAIGNCIDRTIWRYVVDFIYIKCINFPVFNIADCYVCIAAFLLLFCIIFKYKDEDFKWKKK